MNVAIGMVTPPVGCNLYVACGISRIQVKEIIKPVVPYIVASTIALLLWRISSADQPGTADCSGTAVAAMKRTI